MLKLQTKEDEIEYLHEFEFWPHDPKVTSAIKSFSKKPLTPPPKTDPIALEYDNQSRKDETVKPHKKAKQ